jgi:hypothetical protein
VRVEEIEDARWGWFAEPPRRTVFRRLEKAGDWEGRGAVTVTDAHLVFDGERRRRTSLRTIGGVERYEALVWVRRIRSHDWLVQCRSDGEAKALGGALREPARAS